MLERTELFDFIPRSGFLVGRVCNVNYTGGAVKLQVQLLFLGARQEFRRWRLQFLLGFVV